MRKKRKATANNMAQDMPVEEPQSLVFDGRLGYNYDVSVSTGGVGGSDRQHRRLNETHRSQVLGDASAGTSGPSQFDELGIDVPQASASAHASSLADLPAQAITVDGLVSTFELSDTMHQAFQSHADATSLQGWFAVFVVLCY